MGRLHSLVIDLLFGRGSADMIAQLWANQIILGKRSFAQVPAKLKDAVRELLEDAGVGELAVE